MLDNLKRNRIILGELLNYCHGCSILKKLENHFDRLRHCVSECNHWEKIQEQRKLIEKEQFKLRNTKKITHTPKSRNLNPIFKKIGDNLKILRRKKKLSQDQLAELLGYNKHLISLHERGIRKIQEKYLIRYAQFYNVSMEEITGMDVKEARKFG